MLLGNSKVNRERRRLLSLPETLKHGHMVDITPCKDKSMLERPNWRENAKEKWKDNKTLGFLPSYKDHRRRTANGFHTISRGRTTEFNGSQASPIERYNPYVNSHHEIGHSFRRRISQKEISPSEFQSYTSKDIMLKNSTYTSTSIRSIESQATFKLAKAIFESKTLAPIHVNKSSGRNKGIELHIQSLENDYEFAPPKTKGKVTSSRYPRINKYSSKTLNNDIKLLTVKSNRTLEI